MKINIEGQCVSVGLSKRGYNDNHILVSVSIEDDGNFSEALTISNYWLDEMITNLQEAKSFIDKQYKDFDRNGVQWGYKFKD